MWLWLDCAQSQNIPDCQVVSILIYNNCLHVIFLLLLLHLGCTINQRSIPLGYLHLLVQVQQGPLLHILESSKLKRLMELGTRGQEDVHTLLEVFFDISLRSTCFTDDTFSGKKQNFWSWAYAPQVLNYQGFWIIGYQIKWILLCIPFMT